MRKDYNVVHINFSIDLMRSQNFVDLLLNIWEWILESHYRHRELFLLSMTYDSESISISYFHLSLIKILLRVHDEDILTFCHCDDHFRLKWHQITVRNDDLVELSYVYYYSSLSFFAWRSTSYYKDWILKESKLTCLWQFVLSMQLVKDFVNYVFVFSTERIDLWCFLLDHFWLKRDWHSVLFWNIDDSALISSNTRIESHHVWYLSEDEFVVENRDFIRQNLFDSRCNSDRRKFLCIFDDFV